MFFTSDTHDYVYYFIPADGIHVEVLSTYLKCAVQGLLISWEQERKPAKTIDLGLFRDDTRAQNETIELHGQNGLVERAHETIVVPTTGQPFRSRAIRGRDSHDDTAAATAAASPANGSIEDWRTHNRWSINLFCATYGTTGAQVEVRSARCDVSELYECIMWNASMLQMGHLWNPAPTPTHSAEGCRSNLAASINGRSEVDRMYIFRAVYTVAISFSSHTREALFDAVVNTADSSSQVSTTWNRKDGLQDSSQLMTLCEDLLRTRDDGNVEFRKDPMKAYVLESELPNVGRGHETMAKTCLKYLQSLGSYLILKPWAMISEQVRRMRAFPLLEYVQRYWDEHYRRAESLRNELPMLLHHMIEVAVTDLPESQEYLMIEIRRMTLDVGLQLCVRYEFNVLREIYTQMGASSDRNPFPALQPCPTLNFGDIELKLRKLLSKYVPPETSLQPSKSRSLHHKQWLLIMCCSEGWTVDRAVDISQPQSQNKLDQGPGEQQNQLSDKLWTVQKQQRARAELESSFMHLHLDTSLQDAISDGLEASISSISSCEPRTPDYTRFITPPPNMLGDGKDWEMIDEAEEGF